MDNIWALEAAAESGGGNNSWWVMIIIYEMCIRDRCGGDPKHFHTFYIL